MFRKAMTLLCIFALMLSLSACGGNEPEALSGVAPSSVDVQPETLTTADGFVYDSTLTLADSFKQMNALRLSVCEDMYGAVVMFSDDSAWVPVAVNKYSIGSDEFLAASYVMEIEPSITAKKLLREEGFKDIEISPLDYENTWQITAKKDNESGGTDRYEYTIMYGSQSDSYRFTRIINSSPDMMLASRRIAGGYAVQVWTPEGEYRILVQDVREGRFGFVPKPREAKVEFPENDIYYDESIITSSFTTQDAEYTFLLANSILYIQKDGSNYAVPLK